VINEIIQKMRGFTVANSKSFEGRDGVAYSADISKDGNPVLHVINTGTGGCSDITYASPEAEKVFRAAALEYWASEHGGEPPFEIEDTFAAALLDCDESLRRIKRKCAASTCFVLHEDGPDQWRQLKEPFTPEIATRLRDHFGARLRCIVNEELAALRPARPAKKSPRSKP
jgi:hypothetical protein